MKFLLSALSALAAFSPVVRGALNEYAFGSDFYIGSYSSLGTFDISHVSTTFSPGPAPTNQEGELYLRPGLMTVRDEFLYATIQQSSPAACSSTSSQWCLTAQYVGAGGLISGSYAALDGTESVTLDFTLNPDSTWTQTVSVNGAIVSSLERTVSRVTIFGIANECFDAGCAGAVAPQTYTNTTIVLAEADPAFGASSGADMGTTFTEPTTVDGGKTWTIAQIVVPKGAQQNN